MIGPKEYELEPILREYGDLIEPYIKSVLRAEGVNNDSLSDKDKVFAEEIAWWLFNNSHGPITSIRNITVTGLALAKQAYQIARQAHQPTPLVPATVTANHEITKYVNRLVEPAAWQTYITEHSATIAFADHLPAYLPEFQTPDAAAQLEVNRHFWNRAVEIGVIALDDQYRLTPPMAEAMLAEVADIDTEWANFKAE